MKNKFYWAIINLSRSNLVSRFLIDYLALVYYKIFRNKKSFIFNHQRYFYFYHYYNRTVAGERIIEIPIVKKLLYKYQGKKVLEVGNVMSHYYPIVHDVLDKYETAKGVINEDVATVKLNKKYDLIFSISTLEHVGRDYGETYSPSKFLKAVKNLKLHLATGGVLFITLPVSFNRYLAKLIASRNMPFGKEFYMKRMTYLNDWIQVPFSQVKSNSTYDNNFANAEYLYIGQYQK